MHLSFILILQLNDVIWSSEITFIFTVTLNGNRTLLPGKHHMVTHAQLLYYNQYEEDAQGQITSKGDFYKLPMHKMDFDFEIPGKTCLWQLQSFRIVIRWYPYK